MADDKNNKKKSDLCQKCLGTGFSNRKPIRCECEYAFCIKCENNEGFLVHPQELCDYCCGTGNLKDAKSVLNIKKDAFEK